MSRTSGLPLQRLLPYLFCYTDRDATEHLLRCGLCHAQCTRLAAACAVILQQAPEPALSCP